MSRDVGVLLGWLLLHATAPPAWSGQWSATVVQEVDALVTSCVVIPCSFTHSSHRLSSAALRGSWSLEERPEQNIFHEDEDDIIDNFRGRTALTGRLREGNCSLKITKVRDHDDGPFCFRVNMDQHDHLFTDRCARLKFLEDPPEPKLSPLRKMAVEGEPYMISCSVTHTCPAHWPLFTWSRPHAASQIMTIRKDNGKGSWELESVLTFLPDGTDDDTEITCTANFTGGKSSRATHQLHVKGKERYLHIILPLVVGVGAAGVFGGLYVLMKIKYKNRIADLQNRGNGRVWQRISRLSQRMRSSRFMSSGRREPVDLSAYDMPNNSLPSTANNQKISKPRCPSPKSQRSSSDRRPWDHSAGFGGSCDDDYTNTADLSIYGNI